MCGTVFCRMYNHRERYILTYLQANLTARPPEYSWIFQKYFVIDSHWCKRRKQYNFVVVLNEQRYLCMRQ